eukprot:UN30735
MCRQFVSMTRLRIEGLLSAFPKLLDSEKEEGKTKQHTFVETDEVRYIYQPMDSLVVLVVTNKNSNIVKDLNTLRLLAKLIPDYCQGHDEESVSQNAFELVFAFDEAVSLGYAENVDINQIRTLTLMDSHEEKLTKIINDSKVIEAKEMAKRKAKEIEEAKKNRISSPNISGNGYGSGMGSNNYDQYTGDNMKNEEIVTTSTNFSNNNDSSYSSKPARKKKSKKTGMKLRTKNENQFKNLLENKSNLDDLNAMLGTDDNQKIDTSATPVNVLVEEKCSIELERDCSLKKFTVQGSLTLWITDPTYDRIKIKAGASAEKIIYRLHPKIDKGVWKSDGILQLKDGNSKFPIGQNQKQAVVKWKLQYKDDDDLPIKPDIWVDSDACNISITSTCDYPLDDVVLSIPMNERPETEECDTGDWQYSN